MVMEGNKKYKHPLKSSPTPSKGGRAFLHVKIPSHNKEHPLRPHVPFPIVAPDQR